ncbi:MAG: LTA synthase family protein [Lachnospiraceae bacterium]|nr:LTA synthase family protein [Lachnospiraceae bacterium]
MDRPGKISSIAKNIILFIAIPAAIMYLFEAYTHNPFVRMRAGIQVLNIFLFIVIEVFFLFLTGRLKVALRIMCVMFMVLGLAEYYLVEFRGVTLLPWDIGSLGTAAEVASGYNYVPGVRAVLCIIGFIILFFISGLADYRIGVLSGEGGGNGTGSKRKSLIVRCAGVLISCGVIILYTNFVQTEFAERTFGFYTKLFTPTAISERDGTLTAFLMELQYINVSKPVGYSAGEAEEMLGKYEAVPAENKSNIIVIMNEAFSDLSVLGDFETDEDYMPFFHSLQDGDAVTGQLNVSIVGGNTPNTEFEFLTGNTLRFLPEGSIPYQQYVSEGIYAMPSYLKDIGYTTVGMHPYYSKGWERERVYQELGFEKSVFLDGFDKGASKVRDYVSDMACSGQIINEYEANLDTGKPFFAFLVTMQNHSPYDVPYDDLPLEIDIKCEDRIKNIETTERYLTLIKKSDEALKYLTEYFEKQDEPTVIVMFGDHQPSDSVVRPIWEMNGKDSRNLTEEDVEKRYIVPYVIWTNFDIDGAQNEETSANFLGNKVLDIAGAGLYPYRSFLDEVKGSYPVFSAIRAADDDGRELTDREASDDELIQSYSRLQYYELFDHNK